VPDNSTFPWPPYYGHFNFFEERMRQHRCVSNVHTIEGGLYELTLSAGGALRVFICECYSFGAAEYAETILKVGEVDAIIVNSAWCGYTMEAKRTARSAKVGLFKIGDFMSALNKPRIWDYLNEGDAKAFQEKGWT
jgi:hypothetical protein